MLPRKVEIANNVRYFRSTNSAKSALFIDADFSFSKSPQELEQQSKQSLHHITRKFIEKTAGKRFKNITKNGRNTTFQKNNTDTLIAQARTRR